MRPRITLITLGVDDLERAVRFYREGLGWPGEGIVGADDEHGGVAFFELEGGLRMALWSRSDIAAESGVTLATGGAPSIVPAHNVASRTEVDDVMELALAAGANCVRAAADTFWGGYAGQFQDPEGNLWEVAWNPYWELPEG